MGVSSDVFNYAKKQRFAVIPQEGRMKILKGLRCVDHVFLEESMELKASYIEKYNANILVMGNDWVGKLDGFRNCETVYVPRTNNVSTTEIIQQIKGLRDTPSILPADPKASPEVAQRI